MHILIEICLIHKLFTMLIRYHPLFWQFCSHILLQFSITGIGVVALGVGDELKTGVGVAD